MKIICDMCCETIDDITGDRFWKSIKFSFEWVYFRAGKLYGCSSIFVETMAEKPYARGHDHFEGKGVSGDKNQ